MNTSVTLESLKSVRPLSMRGRIAMKPPTNNGSLSCSNPCCKAPLNPIGNVTYGSSRFAQATRHYTLIGLPVFCIILACFGIPAILPQFTIGPVILIYVITAMLPKTTLVTCHHCGHKKEAIGRTVIRPLITHTGKVEAPNIEVQAIETVKLEVTKIGSTQTKYEPDTSDRRRRNSSRFDLFGSEPLSRNFSRRW